MSRRNIKQRRLTRPGAARRTVRSAHRRGLSALEVVMTTALIFPSMALTAYLAMNACRAIYSIIGTMIGSPLL